MIGDFRPSTSVFAAPRRCRKIKVHTKFVPDLGNLATLARADVAGAIETSLKRLNMERLDLVQFHWWDYESTVRSRWPAGCRAARTKARSPISAAPISIPTDAADLDAGVPLVSMQVQYSLIDDRPSRSMAQRLREHGVRFLCYGSVGGGLFSERMLGAPELTPPFENRSLIKYKLIVDEFGGWALVQDLLQALSADCRTTWQ
jgi:aryl-alcohol dehydrogenase-like predicted oxidoreductase